MKYLKIYENFSEDELKRFLQKAVKRGDISLNIDIDKLINKYKVPKIGTFEAFVENEAKFISIGDSKQMSEYVTKLKELGLNVSKLEHLLKDYNRYHEITFLEDDLRIQIHHLYSDEKDEKKKLKIKIDKLLDEQEILKISTYKFEEELRKVVKQAKEL